MVALKSKSIDMVNHVQSNNLSLIVPRKNTHTLTWYLHVHGDVTLIYVDKELNMTTQNLSPA